MARVPTARAVPGARLCGQDAQAIMTAAGPAASDPGADLPLWQPLRGPAPPPPRGRRGGAAPTARPSSSAPSAQATGARKARHQRPRSTPPSCAKSRTRARTPASARGRARSSRWSSSVIPPPQPRPSRPGLLRLPPNRRPDARRLHVSAQSGLIIQPLTAAPPGLSLQGVPTDSFGEAVLRLRAQSLLTLPDRSQPERRLSSWHIREQAHLNPSRSATSTEGEFCANAV